MEGSALWLPEKDPRLSQGDVIASVPFVFAATPLQPLRFNSHKSGVQWAPSDTPVLRNNRYYYLGTGGVGHALVLSHSCELDKGKRRMQIAAVHPIETLPVEHRAQALDGGQFAFVPLKGIRGLGDCYADLRSTTSIDIASVNDDVRLASMTEDGSKQLRIRLVVYYTRLDPSTAV